MIIKSTPGAIKHHFLTTLPQFSKFTPEQETLLYRSTVDYIFRYSNTTQYRGVLKTLSKADSVKDCQRALLGNGDIMKTLKLHLLQRTAGVPHVDVGKDSFLYSQLTQQQKAELKKLAKNSILDKEELDSLLLHCIKECRTFTRKLVYKKLTFIVRHTSTTYEDIIDYLTLESIQNLLFMYPRFQSVEHAVNTTKTITRNMALNYIETFTRKKVNPFTESRLRVASLDRPMDSENPEGEGLYAILPSELETENFELERLLESYTGKKKTFILCLSGTYLKEFSKYLKTIGYKKENDELYEVLPWNTYLDLCSGYLGVSRPAIDRFINKLQRRLSG